MTRAYLLKTKHLDLRNTRIDIPNRAKPKILPEKDDRLFFWKNDIGLFAEAIVASCSSDSFETENVQIYQLPIAPNWLDDADREKTTIRSKIKCDRHDRLWHMKESEVLELENVSRSSF